jgi:hypothetical protein
VVLLFVLLRDLKRLCCIPLIPTEVVGTDKVTVHMEPYLEGVSSDVLSKGYWVTIAAANVLPKLMLHKVCLCTTLLSTN